MPATDLVLAGPADTARRQARELNDTVRLTLAGEQDAIIARHGVPPELRGVVEQLARYSDPIAVLRWLAALDLGAIGNELAAAQARTDAGSPGTCDGCAGGFPRALLTLPGFPGDLGCYCAGCLPVAQAREAHRLARRGINSALARARAANLPATLTRTQWTATLEHFSNRCAHCGGEWYLVEHVKPILQGGGATWGNCVPACFKCSGGNAAGHVRISDTIQTWLAGRV